MQDKGKVITTKHIKSGIIFRYLIVYEKSLGRYKIVNLSSFYLFPVNFNRISDIFEYIEKTVKCEIISISERE